MNYAQSVEDIVALYPKDSAEVSTRVEKAIKDLKNDIDTLCALNSSERTFYNTMQSLDTAAWQTQMFGSILQQLTLLSPDESLRKAAQDGIVKLETATIDILALNKNLFNACNEYKERLKDPAFAAQEALDDEQKYFIEETMKDFHRSGLQLPEESQKRVREIHKLLAAHELQFDLKISSDQRTITVKREELEGCGDSFINALKRTTDGDYILPADMPTYTKVLEECSVPSTRKAYYKMFMQKGYPGNEK